MASRTNKQDRTRRWISRISESDVKDDQDQWRLSQESSREDSILDVVSAHPVPSLQQAFEESIIEANKCTKFGSLQRAASNATADSRRRQLLKQVSFDDSWSTRWRQNRTANFHPLVKLIAQIIFGLHLLHNRQAKSDAEVVHILQDHVNDIDSFLDKNTEDFNLAIPDINERLELLRLPSVHAEVFNKMLDDETFRSQLLKCNDRIEKIIKRTSKGMNAAISDIEQGLVAVAELTKYLDRVGSDWPQDYSELPEVLAAMRGNRDGWLDCLHTLQMKGNELSLLLVQLGTANGEIKKLAATASRSFKAQRLSLSRAPAPQSKYFSGSHRSTRSRQLSQIPTHTLDKALPEEPDALESAVRATLPRDRSRIQKRRSVNPEPIEQRATPQAAVSTANGELTAVKTEPHDAQVQAANTAKPGLLAKFLICSRPSKDDSSSRFVPSPKLCVEKRQSKTSDSTAHIDQTRSTRAGTREPTLQHNEAKKVNPASSTNQAPIFLRLRNVRKARCAPTVPKIKRMSMPRLFRGRRSAEE